MVAGIMQPYLFPYIGYFQLINAVDQFILYDDVNYIKQGWINRNRILLNGKDHTFTLPLKEASSFKLIKDIQLDHSAYKLWRVKFYKTIEQAYRKAPHFEIVFPVIKQALDNQQGNISECAGASITAVAKFLDITTNILPSSVVFNNAHLCAQERVIEICVQAKASTYINPLGGMELYSFADFKANGLTLQFLESVKTIYPQGNNDFIWGLSIIDVLMYNDVETIKAMLNGYKLLSA